MDGYQLRKELAQFTGTEQYHYTRGFAWLAYTDGVRYLCQKGGDDGCYWLLDWIGSNLRNLRKQHEFFQIVVQSIDEVCSIVVTDGNDTELQKQAGFYTDLPQGQYKLFMRNGVLMLPNEY